MFFGNVFSRAIKTLIAAAVCVLLVVGAAAPAVAFGSSDSSPSKGVAELDTLKETSKEAVKSEPRSREAVQSKAQSGPNEVQGSANLEKMKSPANSQNATAVSEQVEEALDSITP